MKQNNYSHRSRRVVLGLASLGLVLLSSGCSKEIGELPEPATHDLFGREISSVQPILRGARDVPAEQRKVLFDLEHEIRQRCMAERGFQYKPAVHSGQDKTTRDPLDMELAEKEGYGLLTDELKSRKSKPPGTSSKIIYNGQSEKDKQAWHKAFTGRFSLTQDSCMDVAAKRAYGTTEREDVFAEVEQLYQEIAAELDADEGYRDARNEWSTCIAEQGFPGDSSSQVAQSIASKADEEGWSQERLNTVQTKVAVADVKCTRSSGWVDERNRAILTAEHALKDKIDPVLQEWKDLNDPRKHTG